MRKQEMGHGEEEDGVEKRKSERIHLEETFKAE